MFIRNSIYTYLRTKPAEAVGARAQVKVTEAKCI